MPRCLLREGLKKIVLDQTFLTPPPPPPTESLVPYFDFQEGPLESHEFSK